MCSSDEWQHGRMVQTDSWFKAHMGKKTNKNVIFYAMSETLHNAIGVGREEGRGRPQIIIEGANIPFGTPHQIIHRVQNSS